MQVTAKLSNLRISPRKVRLVADVIRGLDVKIAQNQLQFMNKKASRPMLKLLNSAVANATNNFKLKSDNLYISELRVDEGQTIKRWQPRAFGRASAINKRTSHISIILDEKAEKHTDKTLISSDKSDIKKSKTKKIDKDIKIVKSLDEVKELGKKVPKKEAYKKEIKDVRREGSDRNKQHLDTVRRKDKGGVLKRMFRRKSI